ncbi:MAG TPA: cupin domain-containing protein, partial [Phycisphaerae bacterium]|nr:cupin domain-containing protein [Phycisphaerae bacterium]
HDWEHEVYVLDGSGLVVTEAGEHMASAGMCVFVPAGEKHQFRNTGARAWKFLCLVPVTAK